MTNMRTASPRIVRDPHDYESGIALITVLLVTDDRSADGRHVRRHRLRQPSHAIDRDQTQVYAAAHAGLEKLTADLASLFVTDFSPTSDDLDELTAGDRLPSIPGFQYTAPGGHRRVRLRDLLEPDPDTGDPMALEDTTITAGPYAGFKGLLTRYDITVTARSQSGSEVRLRRGLQTVAVPVFQFGVFSDTDLTFYRRRRLRLRRPRPHQRQPLAVGSRRGGTTLLFTDRITVYGDVNRKYPVERSRSVTNGMSGPVKILTAIGNLRFGAHAGRTPERKQRHQQRRRLLGGNGQGEPVWNANGATTNNGSPSWTTVSQRPTTTPTHQPAHRRDRAASAADVSRSSAVDLIRRPPAEEDDDNPAVFGQRYFAHGQPADPAVGPGEDITNLPTVTDDAGGARRRLDPRAAPPAGYAGVPIAAIDRADQQHDGTQRRQPVPTPPRTRRSTSTVRSPPDSWRRRPCTVDMGSRADDFTVTGCTGRTLTTFTGCNVSVTLPAAIGTTGVLKCDAAVGLVVSAQRTSRQFKRPRAPTTGRSRSTFPPAAIRTRRRGSCLRLMWVNGAAGDVRGLHHPCRSAAPLYQLPRSDGGAGHQLRHLDACHFDRNKGLIGGFIKIEKQNAAGVWSDVTTGDPESGHRRRAIRRARICGDPTPNAVIRIQRLRDNGNPAARRRQPVHLRRQPNPHDWWPNALYDTREGNYRPGIAVDQRHDDLGGVMNYIVARREQPETVAGWRHRRDRRRQRSNVNGYIVYFSDRRGDHNENVVETRKRASTASRTS